MNVKKTYYTNGKLKSINIQESIDGKVHGEYKCFYQTGQLWYIINSVDWQIRCKKTYYMDGQLSGEIYYSNGKRMDEHKSFYKNGELEFSITYVNDKLHGRYKWFHRNGRLHVIGNYVEDKLNGLYLNIKENNIINLISFNI